MRIDPTVRRWALIVAATTAVVTCGAVGMHLAGGTGAAAPDGAGPAQTGHSPLPARRPLRPAAGAYAPIGPEVVSGEGVVEPVSREIRVSAQVAGVVSRIEAREGQTVVAGSTLLVLADEAERAALAEAEAALEVARAELASAQRGQRSEDVAAAASEAAAARTRAELARRAYQRGRSLESAEGISAAELEQARLRAEADEFAAAAADARRRRAAVGGRREDVAVARARVAAAMARRDRAQAEVERRTVRAPAAGEVLQLRFRPGEYCEPSASDPLLILGDTSRLRVRARVDERDVARVRQGARATVAAEGGADVLEGRVAEVGRRVQREATAGSAVGHAIPEGSVEVLIELPAGSGLVPGARVLAMIHAPERP